MSISKRGSTTPVGDHAPLGDNKSVGDQFNRFETGISAPADEVGNPGPEIGISAPTPDDVGPADNPPADDGTSSGDAGDSLLGLGTWESVPELTIADDHDEPTSQKGGGSPNSSNPESGNIGQLLTLGTNPDGSHFFTGNRNVDATLIGSKWGTTTLTYSFPTSGTNYNGLSYDSNGVSLYHMDLGALQQAAARAAFAQLMAATGLTLTEITETDSVHANIRISQTADQDAPSAYGGFPSDTRTVAGDIWFGRTSQPYYDLAYQGTWGFSTMMHEIGHTMGLKHGHQDYTNSDLSGFFGTSPRFGTQSLTPDRDGQAWSLMTYTPAPFTSGFAGDKINQPQSYMQYDLAALQYLYGANFSTNSGDSVYTFSQTTGEMFINGVGQGTPAGNKIFLTIWDGGGNDTIDASNYANGVTIDLRPGEFSTVDQAQLANHLAYQGLVNLAPGNIAMSLLYNNDVRSLIENATGGTGNDIFVGNIANNILDGGAGSDTVIFTNITGVNVTLNDSATDVIVTHDGETDTLRSIENIQGTVGSDTIIGNSQDNTLSGGAGGTDILTGNDGNDRLIGGGFTVVNNAIITKPESTANTGTATAINPQTSNSYTLVSDSNINNSTTTPHATINATAAGGGLEYYRLDVTAGATGIFDIDFSSIDTWIELVDSTGTVILANNDDSITDAGSSTGNSFLTFTFATAGTYYIRVGRWTQPADTVAQPLAAGTTYTLHISLSSATVNATPFSATNTSSATLDGGEGNDFLQGTLGNDTLTGGNGNDTASFATAFSNTATGVTVDLNMQGVAQNTIAAGTDTLSGIENLVGSQYNDTLTGDGNDNVIEGALGNDTLVGGLGNDTASYAGATAGVTVSLALQGSAQNTINAGTDTLSGFEHLAGSAFNDSLTGDANANTLTGGAGNDTLNPGANAGGIVDLLDGGIGTDTASFAGVASGVTATLNGASDSTATIAGLAIATLRSIENLTGSANADTLTGDGNANVIEGGLGNDTLNGGLGVDTLAFSGSTAVTVNLATLAAQNTGWGSDTISNFENVRTGSGADNVTGDINDNVFFDGGGNDTYNGAAGIDTVDYSAATSTVTVDLNTATASRGTFGGTDTITNMENVVGAAAFANTLTGNTLANRLTGGSALDTIEGRNGADVIFGNAGNDVLLGGTTGALDDGSADTLEGGAGFDFLGGGQGSDILRGGDDDDTLVGGVVNVGRQYFTGVDGGDDTYDGGDGTDTAIMVYDGRIGVGASTVGIAFDLRSLAGNSAITFNGVNVGSLTSIEGLIFRGTTVDDTVGGTGSFDNLFGGAGNDVLDGWYGNDLMEGGLGNDTLIGGAGLDTATYVGSTAGVNVDLRILVAQNTGGQGIDTLSGIEYLTGSAFGDTLRGDDEFNLIIDAGVGAGATALSQTDSIFGYGGNDSILVTRGTPAAAVATNINMDGGDGDDFIELRGGTLSVALATNTAGLSALGTTQGNVTYLVAGATSNDRNIDVVTVDGGAGNDRIILTGVASATINAGSGADLVSISMRGATSVNNYQLTLGAGADIIQLGVGSNAANSLDVAITARTNRVTDFQIGDAGDKFELTNFLNFGLSGYTANSNAFASGHLRLTQSGSDLLVQVDRDAGGVTNVFTTVFAISNGYTGGFTAFNFDGFIGNLTLTGIAALNETITGATGNDVLSGGDGNDGLIGLAGNDTLSGGNGDDTLTGGAGNDSLFGGTNLGDAGFDSAVFSGNRSDYQVNFVSTGVIQVIDLRVGSPDGTDTLSGIERAVFADDDYYVDPNTGVLSSNFPPVVTGPVMGSATEGGGLYVFNPLANASDPDAAPGDGLVVIPVGPLPAGVSFVGGSAATISFSDYALGSVVGQHGWTDATPTSPDNEIVDVSGNRMLRLANDPTSGDFGGPFSPAFAIAAGEATAPADTLTFSFVIQAVNNVADGSRLEIDLGSSDRDDRYNFMAIEYTAGGLRLLQNTPTTTPDEWASNNFDWGGNVQLGALFDASVSHTIQIVFRAVDGSNNDIVEYYVDGMLVGTGSSFENLAEFHAGQPHASAINSVNNVLFRAGDPAGNPFPADGPGGNRQGFYIDDLAMSAYDSHQLQFNANDPAYDHLAAGATQLVTVTYNVADGHGGVTPTSTVITVTGTNDGATITGVSTGAVVESGVGPGNTPVPGTPTASGMLNVSDVDDGQAELTPVNAAGANGYGNFAVAANGSWTYTLDNNDADTQALYVGQVVTDTILVHSEDNTASQTITVTITGTNDAPVITNGSGAASGSVSEGTSPSNLTPAGAAGGLEPAVNYDSQIVSLLAAHPDDMPAVLAGIQAQLPAGSNGLANAIAVMWDYVDDHFSYYDTVINEISGRLSAEYARYLVLGGAPLTGTAAKYAPDGGDVGSSPDRQQSLHDNLLGNLNLLGLNDKLRGPPFGSNPNPDESAYNEIIALLASYGLSDVVNRPYFGGYEGETNLATAYDQTHNLAPPPAGGQLTATDVDSDAVLTWSGSATGVYGAFAITAGGAWTYNLDNLDPDTQALAAGTSAVDTFTATVTDNHGATATTTVTVIVYGTNDAPVAVADTNAGTEDGALVTGTVATNDSDVDTGAVLSYALATPVAGLTINPNGSYSFDPGDSAYDHIALGATQVVTANYIVSDGNGGSSTSTLTITVTGINDAPVITNGPGAASGSVSEGISLSNLTPAGTAGGLEPAANHDGQIVSLLAAHPDDMPAVLAGIQAQLPAGSNGLANAIAVMWDYVDDHFSYYDTVINEISGRLSAEYARYLVLGGAPLTGTAAKYAPDGGDGGSNPDRAQSLHDNLLGNLNLLGLNDKLRGPPNGSNPNPDESAYNQIIALLASYGLSDIVNRPYFGGYEGDANLATAYDQANGLLPPATGGQLTASDIDDDAVLTWSGSATGVYGAFAITAGGAWTYNLDNLDPDTQALAAGTSAVDTFTATVTDNHGATATTTVTVIVYGTNDAPIAVADTNAGTEDGALVTGTVATNDSDVDTGAVLSYALAAPVAGLTINPNGSYSFDPGDSAYDHIALGATQVVTANYIVSDGNGGSSTSTLTITVTGINDAPDGVNDTASAIEDGAVVLGSVAGNDTDIDDGATRSWALVGPVAGLSLDSAGNYVFNPLDPAYQHIALGATQTVVASYRVTDQHGATDIATLTITVAGTNDAPDAANDVNSASEDGAIITGNVGSNDTDIDDGATRSFALVGPAPAGLTFNPDGSYSFDPSNAVYQHIAAGATQTVAVSYTISDGIATDTATLTITVNGANDAPIAGDDVATATEDGALVTGTVATGDTDVDDGATRSYALNGSVAGLTIASDGSYSFDPSNAAYQHIAAGATQTVVATYIVTDDHGATDTATLTITVTGVNDAPDAVDDTRSVNEDGGTISGNVGGNDTDVDDGATRLFAAAGPVPAGLTFNPDGSYSFDPSNAAYQHLAVGVTEAVSFTYTISDGTATDTATLTITVTGTNDAPVGNDDVASATENGPIVTGSVATNDSDVDDGATRTFALVGAAPPGLIFNANGNYSFNAGNVNYQHLAAGATQIVVATYVVTDNQGATDTATLTITVTGTNDGPAASDDSRTAIEDGAIVTGNVGDNDFDIDDDGASRTFALVGPAPAGLTFNADGSYSFNPAQAVYQHIAAGATQTVTAAYTVTDAHGASSAATLTITVAGANDAPDAVSDVINAVEDGAVVTGSLAVNDTDVDDGATRTYVLLSPVAGLTLSPSGNYVFDPSSYDSVAAGATLTISTSYRIIDNSGATDTATIIINVVGVNDTPDAVDDVATAIEDGAIVTGNVSSNDTDGDAGDTRSYALNGSVAGLTIAADGSYSFDPSNAAYQHLAAGATELVVASYTMTDALGATDTATLTITVTGVNDAPDAVNDVAGATEDGAVVTGTVATNDSDVDAGDTRTYALVAPVTGLTLDSNGSYSFDPSSYDTLAFGATQIVVATYTLTDGQGATDTATLTITVTGVNDAPDAVNDVAGATEDGAVVTGTVATNDSDVDAGDTRTYALVAPVTGLTLDSNGSYSFDPSSYDSLAFGATQLVVATYTLTDGQGATDTATLTITVTGVNDAPDAVNDVAGATEDGAVVTGTVATNDSDIDAGDTRTYALNAPVVGLTLDSNGSYSFDPSSYDSLAFGATQIVVATYTLTDGQGATDTATLTITVTGVNDAPDAVNDVASATEDGAVVTGTVATNDSDVDAGDTRTYALVAPVTGLTLDSNGSYSFDPSSYDTLAAGATQTVVATYTLTDGQGATDTATLTITVTGVNDAPDAVNDVAGATEDGAVVTGTVATNDSDVDAGDTRTYALVAPVTGLTLDSNGSYSFDPSSYDTLAFGATQIVVATYTLTDGQGATDTATLTITVTGVNDAPDAVNDVASATEDAAVVTGTVATNDSDVDAGDTRTYALNAPVVGLMLGSTGNYAFDPGSYDTLAAGATQTVVATYTMTDGQGVTDTATLTITVTGVNDDPDAVNDVASATEDGAVVTGTVATNDSDVDVGDTRTYALNAPVVGLTLNANGSYSFDPSSYDALAAGATQTVVATYTLTDGQGATDTATLTITVTGIDDAPVAQPDAFVIDEATILSGNLLADNGSGADSDIDGPTPTISAVNGLAGNVGSQITLASGALLTVNANGTFTYNPNGAFNATPDPDSGASNLSVPDSFTYTLAGGGTVTVSLTITGLDTNDMLLGTSGADALDGGVGLDIMIGFGGNDTYYIDNVGDQVLEATGQGFDAIYTSVSYALTGGTEVEWLTAAVVTSTAAINLTGNAFFNYVLGNNGINVLDGGAGADVLVGYAGNDTYFVDNAGDLVVESAGGGFDVIYTSSTYTLSFGSEVEWLAASAVSGTGAMNLTGNEFGNVILGNSGVNVLNGAGGADAMVGYGGDDTYFVDNLGDVIVDNEGGFDVVYTSVNYTLTVSAQIEWLSTEAVYGTAAINLTGNDFGNFVLGNDGVNVLDGGAGADALAGYGGADTFAFTTALGAGNVDNIVDFAAGIDKIGLDDAIFGAVGGLGALNANAFVIGSGAADTSDRIIYNSATGQLFYDADGLGGGAQILFATLTPGLALTASDFQVI